MINVWALQVGFGSPVSWSSRSLQFDPPPCEATVLPSLVSPEVAEASSTPSDNTKKRMRFPILIWLCHSRSCVLVVQVGIFLRIFLAVTTKSKQFGSGLYPFTGLARRDVQFLANYPWNHDYVWKTVGGRPSLSHYFATLALAVLGPCQESMGFLGIVFTLQPRAWLQRGHTRAAADCLRSSSFMFFANVFVPWLVHFDSCWPFVSANGANVQFNWSDPKCELFKPEESSSSP